MRHLILTLLLIGSIGALLIFHFGKALWEPYYLKLTGRQTVEEVVARLQEKGLGIDRSLLASLEGLTILALKEERTLEVWGHRRAAPTLKISEYPFTAYSGRLGPKLREGDFQIPEGLYRIEYLNPNSQFHLSMKIDYPNAFDREKGRADGREKLGFDIFIHGRNSTVGCIPIGDDAIEELFLLVAEVGKENVSVILSPYDMRVGTRQIEVDEAPWVEELYERIRLAITDTLPQASGSGSRRTPGDGI